MMAASIEFVSLMGFSLRLAACYSWGMKKPAAKPAKGAGAAKSSKGLVPDKGDIVIKGKSFEPFKKGGKK